MEPTLYAGQIILVLKKRRYRKGDIVVFMLHDLEMIKRIADVSDTAVRLLGDNTTDSFDSRAFGPVPHTAIQGKAVLRLPLTFI